MSLVGENDQNLGDGAVVRRLLRVTIYSSGDVLRRMSMDLVNDDQQLRVRYRPLKFR